jgi:hypothetical protein
MQWEATDSKKQDYLKYVNKWILLSLFLFIFEDLNEEFWFEFKQS